MTELTDLNDTDALNTTVTGQSTEGNTADMGGMDNLFQATLGMLSRFRNANIFRLRDNTDNTKLLAFDLSGLTTATTRTVTLPDKSGTAAFTSDLIAGYTTTATAAGTTTLTVSSTEQQYFTGTTTQTVVLPVTSTLVLGQPYRVVNNSTGKVTVNSSGGNTVAVLGPNTACVFTCILITGTTAASWDFKFGSTLTENGVVASTSGTVVDFTGIPAWVRRITVMFQGVSTNGTADIQIVVGDAGGIEATGYGGAITRLGPTALATANISTGFTVANDVAAADVLHGRAVLTLLNPATFLWTFSSTMAESGSASQFVCSGSKALSEALISLRVTAGGTNTFDAGSINILYE